VTFSDFITSRKWVQQYDTIMLLLLSKNCKYNLTNKMTNWYSFGS